MIGKGGLGRFEHAFDACQGKIVAGLFGVIAQRQIGYGQLHLLGELQQDTSGNAVLRADIGMDEGIGLDTVDIAQEQAQQLLGVGAVFLDDEGLQQLIQITQVHRIGGDGGHVAVEDLQHVHGLQQIGGRLQLQELAAFFEQQLIVRADIARTEGHDALVKIA